jgi:ABC-type nitrate/sulfonate/bicarbonate transport system permease component
LCRNDARAIVVSDVTRRAREPRHAAPSLTRLGLRRQRGSVRSVNLAGWSFLALVAALLEASVRGFDLHDSVPAPTAVLRALPVELGEGTLGEELGATLSSYVQGLAIAVGVGVALGVLLGSSRTLVAASSVVIEFLRPIPAVALIPLAILFFGLGVPMRRFVIAYGAVWPILINTLYGVRGSDRVLHDVARTSGVSAPGRLVRVTLPAALPSIATGVRVSAAIALLVGVTAEYVSGTDGVGSYMQRQQLAYQLPELYAALVLVGLLGYSINAGLRATERRFVFWVGEERAARR